MFFCTLPSVLGQQPHPMTFDEELLPMIYAFHACTTSTMWNKLVGQFLCGNQDLSGSLLDCESLCLHNLWEDMGAAQFARVVVCGELVHISYFYH